MVRSSEENASGTAASRSLRPLDAHLYSSGLTWLAAMLQLELTVPTTRGGVTASTEVIAAKRHTGAHASVIVCKNRIANQNLAYAA